MASNGLATVEYNTLPTARDWETMLSMSEVLIRSGMLPAHIKSAAAAVAIIQKGRELGIKPMYALSNIVNIQGKPTANAELMLALIYRDHGDDAIIFRETTSATCLISYKRRAWTTRQEYGFTIEEARTAGLMGNQTWSKYPTAMLRARCISAVARMAFPDSIGGMHLPEEMGAEVDEEGAPIMAQIEPPRDIRPAAAPAVRPERLAPLSAPRARPEPNGAEEQRRRLVEVARARGVDLTEEMDADDMAAAINGALALRGLGFRVRRTGEGVVTARALHDALMALPPRAVDIETGEVVEGDEEGALTDERMRAEIAGATATGE